MTYLELLKLLVREAGTESPSEVTDVAALETEHQEDMKAWLDRAYREIQDMHETWEFRRGTLEISLVAGTRSYDLSSEQADFESLLPYFHPYGHEWALLDESRFNPVFFMPWQDWRGWIEAKASHEGRPRRFTVDPEENLVVYPKPRDAHTFKCDYAKTLDTMTANTDEPIWPSRYHEVIVWFALREYGGYDEASAKYQTASRNMARLFNKMKLDQLPQIRVMTP